MRPGQDELLGCCYRWFGCLRQPEQLALGRASTTNANDQVQLASRHIELYEMTEPGAPRCR